MGKSAMRSASFRWGIAVACAALIVAPAAGAQQKDTPAPSSASDRAYLSHAGPKVVLRQVLAYGRQNTWAMGVRLTTGGSADFGRGAKLRARLGGWTCYSGTAFPKRISGVYVELSGLGGASCNVGETRVASVHTDEAGARLITEMGTIRINQKWSKVPRKLRARVHKTWRNTDEGFRATHWVGRQQDPCGGRRPETWRAPRPHPQGPISIGVKKNGRVGMISVHTTIVEGIDCSMR